MTLQWLLGWWNLVFLVPFILALLYLAIYLASGVTFGDVDADAEVDVDADAHADADVDADHGAEHHHGHESRQGFAGALAWLGIGRVPLSFVLMVLLLTWGFFGFVANQFLREAMPREWMIPLVSLPVAGVGSLLATRLFARTLARVMPSEETYARKRSQLLGEVGEAIYAIDERFGMAAVRDDRGNLFQVPCRVEPGRPSISKGSNVLLVSYDATHNIFHVMPDDGGVLARDGQRVSKGGLT